MTTNDSDTSMTPVKTPRAGWAIAALALLLLAALILVPLSIIALVRNRNLNAQYAELAQDVLDAEATRVSQPAALRQELTQAQQALWPAVADWPTSNQVAQELIAATDAARALGAELVRIEPLAASGDEATAPAAIAQRYRLELRGPWSSILRFLAELEKGALRTLRITDVSIVPGEPPQGQAELTLYASDLALHLPTPTPPPTPQPGVTPTRDTAVVAEILRLETMMRAAETTRSWAAYVLYGEQILQLDPTWTSAVQMLYRGHVAWAQDLVAQGDLEAARSHYAEALRLVPGGLEAQQGLAALDAVPTPQPTVTPAPPTVTPTPGSIVYTVRYGDTLIGIAGRFGVTVADLMAANNLRNTTIYANQRLVIPQR